MLQLMKDT